MTGNTCRETESEAQSFTLGTDPARRVCGLLRGDLDPYLCGQDDPVVMQARMRDRCTQTEQSDRVRC